MRGERFARQLKSLALLEGRPEGVEIGGAAGELGTRRRTVYRAFRVLEGAKGLADHFRASERLVSAPEGGCDYHSRGELARRLVEAIGASRRRRASAPSRC